MRKSVRAKAPVREAPGRETTVRESTVRESTAREAPVREPTAADGADAPDDVTDRICATLSAAIGEGALRPGSKIIEDAIAEHFGVSRTVVRGALGILEHDHLLERKRNRGSFVAEPSIEEAKALFEARKAVERALLELAIGRASERDYARLEAIIAREDAVHRGADEKAKASQAGQFHIELARMSGNGVLTETLQKVVARLSLVMALYEDRRHDNCGSDHHRAILDAVRARDLSRAQRLMDEHLTDIERRVRLTKDRGDRHTFEAVLSNFSSL